MRLGIRPRLRLLLCSAALLALPALSGQAQVELDWEHVGHPNNFCRTHVSLCFGRVEYHFEISRFEITNAQYAAFLNAVAATDPNDLWDPDMASPSHEEHGGIERQGSAGSYTYSAIAGREDLPVNQVSFWDAARFANWLHNGQPTGAQDATTTEDGAYTLTPAAVAGNTVLRNEDALVYIPSEDEWYKAAFYETETDTYYTFATHTDTVPTCAMPSAAANTANCEAVVGDLTPIGSYPGAPGPNGTYDQAGNAEEWTDTIDYDSRRRRGGGFFWDTAYRTGAGFYEADDPSAGRFWVGFRVARAAAPVPAMGPPALASLALGLLAAGLGALAAPRRR